MIRKGIRLGVWTVFGLALVTWVYTVWDVYALESELAPYADKWTTHYEVETEPSDVTAVITVARENILYGPANGKVTIYTRSTNDDEPTRYGTVEYIYEKADGEWRQTESTGYLHGEAETHAQDAFRTWNGD